MTRGASVTEHVDGAIQRVLHAMRTHLGLDVAFVARVGDGQRLFRYVDSDLEPSPVTAGGVDPAEDSYCYYVINGQIPHVLRDPAQHPVAASLPVTAELPVGTHFSVPIKLNDGSVYGTLCSFSLDVKKSVDEGDLTAVRMMSGLLAGYIDDEEQRRRRDDERRRHLQTVMARSDLEIVFQPIVCLRTGDVVGHEALARFPELKRPPDEVLAEAWNLDVGIDLERKAVRTALRSMSLLPPGTFMTVNASPATLSSGAFAEAVRAALVDPARLVVEVTEHAAVTDYGELLTATSQLRSSGLRLAIDDVGMGFSGLNHILRLSPDIIKIDAALIRDVDQNVAKQALISALVGFAERTAVEVIAEGIETEAEWEMVRLLGVGVAQGYFIGRPQPLPRRALLRATG